MEQSVLGSAIKTYRGKNNRTSRSYSYRPSGFVASGVNIFDDDNSVSAFDKLINDERKKEPVFKTSPQKSIYSGSIVTPKPDNLSSYGGSRSSTLKNVQNVKQDTLLPTKFASSRRTPNSNYGYANKENNIRFKSQLFLSDSDSSHSGNERSDVYNYDNVTFKKGASRTKKRVKSKKNFGSTTHCLYTGKSSTKIKRLQNYRNQFKAKFLAESGKSKFVSTPKHSFVELDSKLDISRISRKTLAVDRKTIVDFAKLNERNDADDSRLSFSERLKFILDKSNENGKKFSDSFRFCGNVLESVTESGLCVQSEIKNIISKVNKVPSRYLSPVNSVNKMIDFIPNDDTHLQFSPVGNSTPRQSEKYDLEIRTSSPMKSSLNRSNEFHPNDYSAASTIQNRLSGRCEVLSLCDEFKNSCSIDENISKCDVVNCTVDQNEYAGQKVSSRMKLNCNSESGYEEKLTNASHETNYSPVPMDLNDGSVVSSVLNESKCSSANCSHIYSNDKAGDDVDEDVSLQSVGYSTINATVEMKSHELGDPLNSVDKDFHCTSATSSLSTNASNINTPVKMCCPEQCISEIEQSADCENVSTSVVENESVYTSPDMWSESTDEKFETIVSVSKTSKLSAKKSDRSFLFVDSLLASVLQPSNSRSSAESSSLRASVDFSASPRKFLTSTPRRISISSLDSSDSDEQALTVVEKVCTAPSSPTSSEGSSVFAGFEGSIRDKMAEAKLVALKGERDKLTFSPATPARENVSISLCSNICEGRRTEVSLADVSPLRGDTVPRTTMSYTRLRDSGILRRDVAGIRPPRKSVTFDAISKFEPVLEEKAEETPENDGCDVRSVRTEHKPLAANVAGQAQPNRGYFTERRKKRCPLPTVNEGDAEIDEGVACSQNSILSQMSSTHLENQTIGRSSMFLAKGKKWRRSFITLKQIRDFGFNPDLSNGENKGRCWRANVEHLIQNQMNTTSFVARELDECTVLRTGFDGNTTSGFEEGDTVTEKPIHSRRTRFSFSIGVDPLCKNGQTQNLILENSLAWLAHETHDSILLNEVNVSAGDHHFRNRSLPRIDFSVPHTARDIVLCYCQQSQPLPFEDCFDESILRSCKKIGEGVYGEVFALKKRSKSSVIKIIPIEGDQKVNGERQKKFDEILSELVISIELSNLKNRTDFYTNCFAEVQRCWCVQGRYPARLLSLWREYDQIKGSDNDSPKIFKDDQLYIILELNDGGEDLESFEFNNAQQTLSVFKQVANALAVAEQAYKFEHRDLHWGNVLISRTKHREANFVLGERSRNVQLYGVKVTIIDYTLSRISVNSHTLYNNIGEDPELFTAEGDFQFEVYRLMKKEVNDTWDRYVPKTNVIWLYYLLDKMINEVRYRRVYTKTHLTSVDKLKRLYASTMDYESSCSLVENQPI